MQCFITRVNSPKSGQDDAVYLMGDWASYLFFQNLKPQSKCESQVLHHERLFIPT